MFRVTTYVTSSPHTSRRSRSAAAKTRSRSAPRAAKSRTSSSSPSSSPDERERRGIAADDERHRDRLARRPAVLAREPVRVRRAPDRRRDRRIGPAVEVGDVLGIERQPRRELEPARPARLAEPLDLRPRRLGVDVVDRHGRDAAPVVDPRVEQEREVVVGEVRRRLHVDVRAEDDPGDRDRPEVLLERRVRVVGHPRPRLRAEVLDDHLAEVPVLARRASRRARSASIRSARVSPIPIRIPLVNGIASSPASRIVSSRRAGHLVGRGPVRPAPRREPLGGRLEHDPHRRGDRPQRGELVARHHARVEVRQQAGLVEDAPRAAGEVLERRRAAERGELLARDAVARLGPVAEREERLGAARLGARARDREHLVLGEVRALAAPRRPRERAVAADVAAERRQRDEHLRRVRDERARGAAAAPRP